MKRTILTILLAAIYSGLFAQEHNTLSPDSLRNQFEAEAARTIENFEEFSEEARKEYERYEQQMRKEYFDYVKSIKNIWGNDTIVDDTKSEWVEYSEDYKSRSVVNFETGEILIEVAFDDIQKYDSAAIDQRISAVIEKMLESRGSTCPYSSKVDVNEYLTKRPILEGLIDLSKYTFPDSAEVASQKPRNARPAPPTPKVRGKELELANNSEKKENIAASGETMASRVAREGGNIRDNKEREEARKRAHSETEKQKHRRAHHRP